MVSSLERMEMPRAKALNQTRLSDRLREPEERKPETVFFRKQKRAHSSGQELEQQGVEWKEGHHGHEEILLEPHSLHDIHGPEG